MVGTNGVTTRHAEEQTEWVQAHEALSRLARERAVADAEEGHWLLAALRSAAHVHLGFGSFAEYIERLFGYKPRSTQEKLRVAEALEQLPAIATELQRGTLNWSAVRELTRVAVAKTEAEWLDVARGKTVHQLEATPATRRTVLRRDHGRCVVPGCRSATFLDVHHLDPRSEGGGHAADNLITLCAAHHRAAQRGELIVTGRVSTGVRFGHADGSVYGETPAPRFADVRAKAFAALRGLGFRETEVRRALADCSMRQDGEANLEQVVRTALTKLTASA